MTGATGDRDAEAAATAAGDRDAEVAATAAGEREAEVAMTAGATGRDGAGLAVHGGPPVRTTPFPVAYDASGRWFGQAERAALDEVVQSGALTRWGGTKVDALEAAWAERLGRHHAVAVSSGSAALHVALAAFDFEPGSEVVTSPVTDMGTVVGIVAAGLVPVFADVDRTTGMIDATTVEPVLSERTVAILPVHLFGQVADLAACARLAEARGLALIEDASQAHFSRSPAGLAGTVGDIACFSLQQTKVVTCGEGGIVVTDRPDLEERARLFQNKGWRRGEAGPRAYPLLGLNYRMPELSGAFALSQLARVDEIVATRARTLGALRSHLADRPGVRCLPEPPGSRLSWWAAAVQLPGLRSLDEAHFVEAALQAEGCPWSLGYLGDQPLPMVEALQTRSLWGNSGIPWTLSPNPPTYHLADCPDALWFMQHTFVMHWNEGLTEADALDAARAVEKVADYLAGVGA